MKSASSRKGPTLTISLLDGGLNIPFNSSYAKKKKKSFFRNLIAKLFRFV